MDFDDSGWGDTDTRCDECVSSDLEFPDDDYHGSYFYH